ncbi:bifunctional biotin-[acetyl-CoA-carboxylase] synthetase/biotin operon repressor [Nitzschia inconspicua]|uniref:Bifunctional biotin-[acetyl-CoA-carboxylase] synthetase/biotin operon repressor n=1 Tax=Nitzschia inconspicua TaxID=303405 RepID=A0A9K3L766_9STRA|nr:bifunctional biotin-[acetyl-CoA-carboxylase] synthetase/biotin operon repressor [Nitzschia inconspicua]
MASFSSLEDGLKTAPGLSTKGQPKNLGMTGTDTVAFDEFVNGHRLCIHHLNCCVDSTQDEAKRRLQDSTSTIWESPCHFAVIADNQRNGRGTSGRSWVASPGNLFMTYCLPMDDVPMSKLTLVPLSIGVLVAEVFQTYVDMSASVSVKWPNDVLVNQKKVAGTLIENCAVFNDKTYWLLIGIGVNLASHPSQLPAEVDALLPAREATCLQEHMPAGSVVIPSAVAFGIDLSKRIQELVVQGELGRGGSRSVTSLSVIQRWRSFARMGENHILRQTGEKVIVVDVENDGQLRVLGEDGRERLLVSDYFV